VFITGDTGVGKELVAKVIHDLSGRKGPFVAVNVAGLDDAVFSDTLFGHRKGAFTGAEQHREGLLAQASGGTLFLDEIGDLRESSQVKLLRLLQDHTYYPLGADVPRRSDARVLVATNRGVQNVIAEGAFRKDLYYRLRTHHVHIPPLSERKEDIPLLLDHFVAEAARALNRRKPSLSPDLNIFLTAYNFPGNVRELHAMVFDAVARHKTGRLAAEDFKESLVPGDEVHSPPAPLPAAGEAGHLRSLFGRFPTLREAELLLISEALRQSGNNQGTAAALLGITRQALNKRLHRTPELSALRKT
jgi:DNA-binding NtrC family response regulator